MSKLFQTTQPLDSESDNNSDPGDSDYVPASTSESDSGGKGLIIILVVIKNELIPCVHKLGSQRQHLSNVTLQ